MKAINSICIWLLLCGSSSTALATDPQRTPNPWQPTLHFTTLLAQNTNSDDDLLAGGELLQDNSSGEDSLFSGDLLQGGDLLEENGLSSGSLFNDEDKEPEDNSSSNAAAQEHAKLFKESSYPSALTCATCHPKHYKEWSVSQHAYAQLSPLMLSMQNAINLLTASTNGDFCLRCHAPVGSELKENMTASNLDRHPASREGITCVGCHRINKNFGKVTGRITLEPGDIYTPIYGPTGNEELERVLNNPSEYRVSTSAEKRGRGIHSKAEKFFQLATPSFCATCHDVIAPTGLRIEEAFSEFKNTAAAKEGTSCQDCHMSKEQGKDSGYEHGPAAIIGGSPTRDRKLTNHLFSGPDYSIVHPGIFPHNVKAAQFKTMAEWLEFDWEAGWGTDAFEDQVSDDQSFPESWSSIDDRYDARAIINEQQEALAWAKTKRVEVLRNAFDLSEIRILESDPSGLRFDIDVKNISNGHTMPNGFDAERIFFLQVNVTSPSGKLVYQSGDRDPNGDLRDWHSRYVRNGEIPADEDLFNLQSKFMVRVIRGGEREQVLPAPLSLSALPYVRPESRPSILYGQPKGARKHRKGIEPLGKRTAEYKVPASLLTEAGSYDIEIKFISQALPVNLVSSVMAAGFDYNMTPKEVADKLVDGAVVIREKNIRVDISQ